MLQPGSLLVYRVIWLCNVTVTRDDILRTCVISGQQQAVDAQRLHRGGAAAQLMVRNAAHVNKEHP
jgi:hypothetical protein